MGPATWLLALCSAVACLHVAFARLVTCTPSITVASPAAGDLLQLDPTSKYTRFEIDYRILWPPGADELCAAVNASSAWAVQLQEHHSVEPGHIRVALGDPIFLIVTEPGSYVFEVQLLRGPAGLGLEAPEAPAGPVDRSTPEQQAGAAAAAALEWVRVSADILPFDMIVDPRVGGSDAIAEAFDQRRNVYDAFRRASTLWLPPAVAAPPPAHRHQRASAADGAGVGAYYDSLPPRIRQRIRPLQVVLVGGVAPPFDGTKQFIVQYETAVDRRVVTFTHLDMMSNPEEGAQQIMAKMVMEAGIPLYFHRVPLPLHSWSTIDEFLGAGNSMARAAGWCDLSRRVRNSVVDISRFFSKFDVIWRVNHDAKEEYLQQVPRLVDPAIVRINDLVGRLDMPCRYSRRDAPGQHPVPTRQVQVSLPGSLPGFRAALDADVQPGVPRLKPPIGLSVPSRCYKEGDEANRMQAGWIPWQSESTAYTWRHHQQDLERVIAAVQHEAAAPGALIEPGACITPGGSQQRCAAAQRALERAWEGLDLPLKYRGANGTAQLPDPASLEFGAPMPLAPPPPETTQRPAGWVEDSHFSWHPISYELIVVPSHFVATHELAQGFAAKAVVVPGLNSREVQPIAWSEFDESPPWAACSRLWMGPDHDILLSKLMVRPRVMRAAKPPIVMAYVGRIVREKGTGLFLHAVAALRASMQNATALGDTVRIVVIGSASTPGYLRHMRGLAQRLGVHDVVDFVGFASPAQLVDWYKHRCISAVIAPYVRPLSETFGLVLTEAMAAELPVVHFGVGGIQDYSRPGRNSLTPANVSAAALADVMDAIALPANAPVLRELGRQAAAFVQGSIRKELNAWHIHSTLREERAAAMLLYRHVAGGFASLFPGDANATCSNDPAEATSASSPPMPVRALTWHELLLAVPPAPVGLQPAASGAWRPQARFPPAATDAGRLRLDVLPIVGQSEAVVVDVAAPWRPSAGLVDQLDAATAALPGFEDVLCRSAAAAAAAAQPPPAGTPSEQFVHPTCATLHDNVVRLVKERLTRTGALCTRFGGSSALMADPDYQTAGACVPLMDLIPPSDASSSNSDIAAPLWSFRAPLPPDASSLTIAVVDSRLPHTVLASGHFERSA